MKRTQDYYTLKRILAEECQYMGLLGERSNGKSYAVKEFILRDLWEHGNQFAYVRRWREDIKTQYTEGYFNDAEKADNGRELIKEITHGKYTTIAVYQGAYYWANYNEHGKKERDGKPIGHIFCLTGETHVKSVSYPLIYNFVFEEWITDKGYLPDEPHTLMSLISTILRRRKGRVFLIGNTMSQVCPYFAEWGLENTLRQKQGEINIYHYHTNQVDYETGNKVVIKIGIEMCANTDNNSQLFFGKRASMITSGGWDIQEFLHLPRPYEEHEILYTMYYRPNAMMAFKLQLLRDRDTDDTYLYVYPYTKTIPAGARLVSPEPSVDRNSSISFSHARTKYDIIVLKYLAEKRVCYSDNLTGSNFNQSLKGGI